MTQDAALKLVDELVTSPNLKKHLLACETIMQSLFDYFQEKGNVDFGSKTDWGNVGLLHDADQDVTGKSMELHTEEITKKLHALGEPQQVIDAIRGHADKAPRITMMAKAMYATDELSGLIVAATLIRPDRQIANLTAESVLKRFKESSFAKGANRDMIKTCEPELGITLAEFVEIALSAMQKIAGKIGL